jgi:MFS family permease
MVKKMKDSLKIERLKRKTRRISISEGIFNSAKISFSEKFIQPFAIAINASNQIVASITAIIGLLWPLSQIFSSRLMEKYSRKKIILRTIVLEAFSLLPLIIIAILFSKGIITSILPILMLLTFAIYMILNGTTSPIWFSWMGDIIDERHRGKWFSKRNLIMGFVSISLAIVASFFLDYFKNIDLTMQGFMILFGLAFICRIVTYRHFKQQYEPKIKLKKGYYFSFWDFVKESPKNNLGRFSIYRLIFTFTTAITSALLSIYLLRTLEFSYLKYMVVILAGTTLSLFTLEIWGKIADKYGNYRVLCISSIIIPVIPILWILNSSVWYLIFVPSLATGIGWAGFHLAERNFIYDNVSQSKRGLAMSYYNVFWGIGIFLGASFGGLLIKYVHISIIQPIIAIFLFGAVMRMISVFFILSKIKEVKKKQSFKSSKDLGEIILKQAKPTIIEEVHEIMSIRKYLDVK